MNIEPKLSLILLGFCLSASPAFSQKDDFIINWNCLNLSPNQAEQIRDIDYDWLETSSKILPKLHHYEIQLQQKLSDPRSNEKEILELQKKIFVEKERLQKEALENFLSKKRLLNEPQKAKLYKIIK